MANEDRARVTGGGYTIDLEVTSLSHTMDKQLIIIPIPNEGAGDTVTYLVDLQRCKEAVTIQGNILPTSTSSGITQKNAIINIMRKTQTDLTLTWGAATGTESMTGNIQKCDIKEEAGRVGGYTTGETKRYNIQLVFVRGVKYN